MRQNVDREGILLYKKGYRWEYLFFFFFFFIYKICCFFVFLSIMIPEMVCFMVLRIWISQIFLQSLFLQMICFLGKMIPHRVRFYGLHPIMHTPFVWKCPPSSKYYARKLIGCFLPDMYINYHVLCAVVVS